MAELTIAEQDELFEIYYHLNDAEKTELLEAMMAPYWSLDAPREHMDRMRTNVILSIIRGMSDKFENNMVTAWAGMATSFVPPFNDEDIKQVRYLFEKNEEYAMSSILITYIAHCINPTKYSEDKTPLPIPECLSATALLESSNTILRECIYNYLEKNPGHPYLYESLVKFSVENKMNSNEKARFQQIQSKVQALKKLPSVEPVKVDRNHLEKENQHYNLGITDAKERIHYLTQECSSLSEFKNVLAAVEDNHELHAVATGINWDYGESWLTPPLEHPLCDSGTVLEVYWLGQPLHYSGLKEAPSSDDNYHFLKKIENNHPQRTFKYNDIPYEPLNGMSDDLKRCVVKYSGIPDSLLTSNQGGVKPAIALDQLRTSEFDVNEPDALSYMAKHYTNSKKYKSALRYADKLMELDNKHFRYRFVKRNVLEAIARDIRENQKPADIDLEFYQNTHVSFLKGEIECLNAEIKSEQSPPGYMLSNLRDARKKLAELHVERSEYSPAIESLETLLRDCDESDYWYRHYLLRLAQIHALIPDAQTSLEYIDKYLEGKEISDHQYTHKYKILKTLGDTQEAENILDKMIGELSRIIELNKQSGKPKAVLYGKKANLLSIYRGDFKSAAEVQQSLLDEKLYDSDLARDKENAGLTLLQHNIITNEFLKKALAAIQTENHDEIENLRDEIKEEHVDDIVTTWSADLPWTQKTGYIHLLYDQLGESIACVMEDGLESPATLDRASSLSILREGKSTTNELMDNPDLLDKGIQEWKNRKS